MLVFLWLWFSIWIDGRVTHYSRRAWALGIVPSGGTRYVHFSSGNHQSLGDLILPANDEALFPLHISASTKGKVISIKRKIEQAMERKLRWELLLNTIRAISVIPERNTPGCNF